MAFLGFIATGRGSFTGSTSFFKPVRSNFFPKPGSMGKSFWGSLKIKNVASRKNTGWGKIFESIQGMTEGAAGRPRIEKDTILCVKSPCPGPGTYTDAGYPIPPETKAGLAQGRTRTGNFSYEVQVPRMPAAAAPRIRQMLPMYAPTPGYMASPVPAAAPAPIDREMVPQAAKIGQQLKAKVQAAKDAGQPVSPVVQQELKRLKVIQAQEVPGDVEEVETVQRRRIDPKTTPKRRPNWFQQLFARAWTARPIWP